MLDALPCSLDQPETTSFRAPKLPRSEGCLRLAFKRRGDVTAVDRLFQSGCLKARFAAPNPPLPGDAVLINTSGGLTGGDALTVDVKWAAGTRATITGQAAEKIYRSLGDTARIATRLTIETGAAGEWLPQETILFDRAALQRDTAVHLASDASFLGLEAVVFGRSAMGETVAEGRLRDGWRIWRDGRLIYADVLALDGAIAATLRHPAVADSAIAFASLLWVGPDAVPMRDRIRAALGAADAAGGCAASSWNGLLAIRIAARDGAGLRRRIVRALTILRPERALPRLWQC